MRKNLRRMSAVMLAMMVLFSFGAGASSAEESTFAKPGTYVVQTPGWISAPIISVVTVDESRILSIETNHSETNGFGEVAIKTLTGQILANQTLNVDMVSGATLTSGSFIRLMREALINQAGGDSAKLMTEQIKIAPSDTTADVVVVGSGAAGFATAIRVATERPDWKVMLLEKDGILGGTSLRAAPGPATAGTQIQEENGYFGNTLEVDGGGPISNPREDVRAYAGVAALEGEFADYYRVVSANSKYLVEFANEITNIATSYTPGVHGMPSSHRSVIPSDYKGNVGIMNGLQATALAHGIDIRVNNRGTELLNPDGEIAGTSDAIGGIRVETPGGAYDIMLNADNPNAAVVLATGGIAGNKELKEEYFAHAVFGENSDIANIMYYVNSPASARHLMGDGHIMAKKVGAALDMMHAVTARAPSVPGQDISKISNEQLPHQDNFMSGAVPRMRGYLNIDGATGRRFSNEPSVPTEAFFNEAGIPIDYYGILNQNAVMGFNTLKNWYTAGLFTKAETIEEAADLFGFTGETKEAFLDEMKQVQHVALHNTATAPLSQADAIEAARTCDDVTCPSHGVAIRDDFPPNSANAITSYLWGAGPYYVSRSRVVPILHGTYGGIRINLNGQAIRGEDTYYEPETLEEANLDDVIPGLYAAGTSARPPRGASPNLTAASAWGIAAANHILGLPSYDSSYWE